MHKFGLHSLLCFAHVANLACPGRFPPMRGAWMVRVRKCCEPHHSTHPCFISSYSFNLMGGFILMGERGLRGHWVSTFKWQFLTLPKLLVSKMLTVPPPLWYIVEKEKQAQTEKSGKLHKLVRLDYVECMWFQQLPSCESRAVYAGLVADERHVALVGSSRELKSTGLLPIQSYISDEGFPFGCVELWAPCDSWWETCIATRCVIVYIQVS
jgi:hypothetical protein